MATRLTRPQPRSQKPNKGLMVTLGVLAALFFLLPVIIGLYTDFLWFGEVDFRGVFNRVIIFRVVLFVIFALLGAAVAWAAAHFAWRGRQQDSADIFGETAQQAQYRAAVQDGVKGLLTWVPAIVGIMSGLAGQRMWRVFMMWFNGGDFGTTDPQFGKDLGFYAFSLPAISAIVGTLSMLLAVAFVIGAVGHYMLGGIRIGNNVTGVKGMVSKPARIQLAVTAGLWMLTKAVTYWLDRYYLLSSQNDIFTGASYTAVNAMLPAKIILTVIAVVVAAAFFASIVFKDFRVPVLATVLMLVSSIVVGNVWPALLEQFSVKPNRQAKEYEYIGRNIEATREAYGLTDDKVTYMENWGGNTSNTDVAKDAATISNLRLLDPDIISPTFTQNQQLRNFYGFPDQLAMDRYEVDGQMRDYVVAAREMDPNALSENQRDWINRHTVYTHGNGFVAAQANTVDEAAQDAGSTRGGLPIFTVSDLQANAAAKESGEAEELGIKVEEPRIYFGPVIASAQDGLDYAIVGDNGQGPVEYDTDNSTYTYTGKGGVDIGNPINRVAYAVKYQELSFLLSDRVGGNSKVLYDRDPRERVEKVAPWLTTDSKTYPAVIDGRVKWIVDGYTTLSQLPYSTRTSLQDTTQDALNPDGTTQRLITDNVGYIRNSVKATVDAYDGTVDLYAFDESDPVLNAWMKSFPGTVRPNSDITDSLRDHLRYPEDLFKVQRDLLARYHVDDPGVFFNNDAFWSVPNDPTAPEGRDQLNQPPYYVVAADPETNKPSFQLITPFRGLNREFLSAHMAVSSDPETYGNITVRVLPTNTQTQGPKQAQDALMSSDQVARDRTLWEGTNDLKNGNLLTLPVGGGEILYVEPIYSQRKDQASAFPKLLRVLVFYRGQVGYAPTVSQALKQVGIHSDAAQEVEVVDENAPQGEAETTPAEENQEAKPEGDNAPKVNRDEALNSINDALRNLESARNGSFEEYGRAIDQLDRAVAEYQKAQ
ncbi:UPF0182 family protein [uncultured Corynebacterium sp.]|uniref:UPF0182 family protein n=1 Tax=uncultured Corynebacterium sp. TaxID=159447 RepID=UPI002592C569|nr:UPF0182 family protein [uncultured Corynebacterium sp.]